jgi:hypothetical protein
MIGLIAAPQADQAAIAWDAAGRQFQGSSSPRRQAGWSLILLSTSASQVRGSRSLSLAVTMSDPDLCVS